MLETTANTNANLYPIRTFLNRCIASLTFIPIHWCESGNLTIPNTLHHFKRPSMMKDAFWAQIVYIHISLVLISHNFWINIYSCIWKLQQIQILHSRLLQYQKKKNLNSISVTLSNRKKNIKRSVMLVKREKYVKFAVTPSAVVLKTLRQQH